MPDETPIIPTENTTTLSESILVTVKRACDIEDDDDAFDSDIIRSINSYLQILWMQNVGVSGFKVTSEDQTWAEFLGPHADDLQMAVSYICKRVKLAFDPPSSSTLYNAYKEQADELGWYLGVESDILSGYGYSGGDDDEED
jgi:hypothetical protein